MSLDSNRLTKSVKKLRKFLKQASNTPRPEEVHSFRTHARRLEATLEALGLDSEDNERPLRDLVRLRKRAGKVRDMDVLTANALTVRLDDEQNCSVQLLEYLGAERYRQAKKLGRAVESCRPALRQRLKRCLQQIGLVLGKQDDEVIQAKSKLEADAMASALQLSSDLKVPEQLDKGNLHSYRLKAKKLRYVLQMSNDADHQEFVDKLGKVKKAIGEWHDWEELSTIATELLDHGTSCKLLGEIKTLSEAKYDLALSLTNEMRETYLPRLANGAGSAEKDTRSLAQPVLEATSAIGD